MIPRIKYKEDDKQIELGEFLVSLQENMFKKKHYGLSLFTKEKGRGRGNWGHAGRPGQVGGSSSTEGASELIAGTTDDKVIMLHGTKAAIVKKILKEGIKPQTSHNWPNSLLSGSRRNSVFVTQKFSNAEFYAREASSKNGQEPKFVIFKVMVKDSSLIQDEEDEASCRVKGSISPEDIMFYYSSDTEEWTQVSHEKKEDKEVFYVPVIISGSKKYKQSTMGGCV